MAVDPGELGLGDMLRDWDARSYLRYYYGQPVVPDDEVVMFRFLADALRAIHTRFDVGLDLGCGPVLHRAAQVVPWVARLEMADYQESNLEEIRRWLRKDPGAFDWSVYFRAALAAEVDGGSLEAREALLRAAVHLQRCDLRDALPLGKPVEYPLIVSYYCTEWVTPTFSRLARDDAQGARAAWHPTAGSCSRARTTPSSASSTAAASRARASPSRRFAGASPSSASPCRP